MHTDYEEGYLTARAHLEDQRFFARQTRRMRGLHPDSAAQAIAEWAQQNAVLQAKVDTLRAEIQAIAAENERLRNVVAHAETAIQELVNLSNKQQAELLQTRAEAANREQLLKDTQRRLTEALNPADFL